MKLGDTGAKARLVTVTPKQAADWLETTNGHNRSLSTRYVDRLTQAFERGEYLFTGDTVKFDTEGNLIDGQHRLAAVVQYSKPLPMLLVEDLPFEVIHVIDAEARSRSLGDVLRIGGMKNAKALAAVIKTLWPMEIRGLPESGGDQRLTVQQALEFIDRRPSLEQSTVEGRRLAAVDANPLTAAEFGAFWDILTVANPREAIDFIENVAFGGGERNGNAVIVRRRIHKHMLTEQHRSKVYVMTLFTKAWNAEMEGRVLSRYVIRDDDAYPLPIGFSEWEQAGQV